MANPKHVARLKEGVEAWNQWREKDSSMRLDAFGNDAFVTDLSGADLSELNLNAANLHLTNLANTNLEARSLVNADLSRADLRGANLHRSNLVGANLSAANLCQANLTFSGLFGANFDGAILAETNLTAATLSYTIITNTDLSRANGLETVRHAGPSSIGIDTIYKSQGKIPHVFLRGAGVPENFIEYMASLVGSGIEFYSLFISYSTHDQEFAERLHADLQDKGVRCWFAPHDMRSGKKVYEQIDEAIRVHNKLLLILSPESMESEWVKTEISKARKREIKEGKHILFPIRLCSFEALRDWECFDSDAGKDSAREIREYFIPDFSNWKDHDAYRLAFDRLLKDLQGKTEPSSV
jgi:uncharacterized protein YjbI with pentapeptide repeats